MCVCVCVYGAGGGGGGGGRGRKRGEGEGEIRWTGYRPGLVGLQSDSMCNKNRATPSVLAGERCNNVTLMRTKPASNLHIQC